MSGEVTNKYAPSIRRVKQFIGDISAARFLVSLLCLLTVISISVVQATEKYDRIREKTEELVVAINKAKISPLSRGKDSKLQSTYSDYAYLLTPDKLDEVAGLVESATDPAEKAQREKTSTLLRYHAINYEVSSVLDNCVNSFRDNQGNVDGKSFILRGINYTIGQVDNPDIRRKYSLGAASLYTPFNVYMGSLITDLNSSATAMGYEGYYQFLSDFEGWDLNLMDQTGETLLTSTSDSYQELLTKWSESEVGLILRKLRSYDADRLFFFPSISDKVGEVDLLDVARSTLKDCGINLKNQRTLKIDLKDREFRSPRATAYPVQPEKAEISMVPTGQITDIVDFLGAVGEAEFHYLIPKELPFEDVFAGTNIGPATYRALFEMICEEPAWIEENIKLNGVSSEEVAEAFRLRRLYNIRRAVANYQFQLKIHSNPKIDSKEYNVLMKEVLLWKHTKNDANAYQMTNDDYRSGGLFMGYALATQIRSALIDQLGSDWYKSKDFGEALRRGAEKGLMVSVDELLGLWGINSFDPSGLAL